MIIVSQDKNKIINFDNIVHIFISDNSISYGVMSGTGANDLGTYATEERAKEVLQEIIEKLYPKSTLDMDIDGISFGVQSPVYEMPLE